MFKRTLLLVLATVTCLAGCDDEGGGTTPTPDAAVVDQGGGCATSADCADGALCVAGACAACDSDDQCAADGVYGAGATCAAGACTPCAVGSEGCACTAGGACDTGECVDGICAGCDRGSLGCACLQSGGCDAGGRCNAEGVCEECPAGEAGCACGFNDTCAAGLLCQEGVCAEPPCPAGTANCPCADGACEAGLACNDDSICYECANDMAGCPCVDGACEDALVCDADSDTCREPATCEELDCGAFRLCEEPAEEGQAPTCLEACQPGYFWDGEACAEITGASCDAEAPNSIAAQCEAEHRACTEPVADAAVCGDCLAGFRAEGDACVALATCASLDCAGQGRACTEADPAAATDAACGACLEDRIEVDGACQVPTCELLGCAAANQACDPAAPACGDCLEGFVDQGNGCELFVPATCEPGAPGSIAGQCAAQNRSCEPGAQEAACGGCLEGFAVDAEGACAPTTFCADLPCAAQGRVCAGEPFAACGGCEPGAEPLDPDDPNSACVASLTCADIECLPDEFCIEGGVGVDAVCNARPCPEGEAFRVQGVGGECVRCEIECGETGETGRTHAYTLADSNECLCETETGFYPDVSLAVRARPCDEDGDGWVRLSARAALESDDPSLVENARCGLKTIDRFELRNELGQSYAVWSCEDGLLPAEDGECVNLRPLGLYESTRNDSPVDLERAGLPALAADGVGRALRAEELTPLTRFCVSPTADFNDNGVSDVNEYHEMDPPEGLDSALIPFLQMAFFVELTEGFFQAPAEGQPFGRYVIQERSRCADGFNLGYAEGEDEYWRSCTVKRDAAYTEDRGALTPVGFDFARFSCDDAAGPCATPAPVVRPGANPSLPAEHGLCAVRDLVDLDGWRGMTLHSQFKCVQVAEPEALPDNRALAPQLKRADELYDGDANQRKLQFNQCAVACPEGDPACEADCGDDGCEVSSVARGGVDGGSTPALTCTPVLQDAAGAAIPVGSVGFAAVRHRELGGGVYQNGCINEWQPSGNAADALPWKALCPGYAADPVRVIGESQGQKFGELSCGCGLNYGGPGCSVGCPDAGVDLDGDQVFDVSAGGLFYGGTTDHADCPNGYCPIARTDGVAGREGFWLCGGFAATTTEQDADDTLVPALQGGEFAITGGITASPFEGGTLCENDDCDTGFTVRTADFTDRTP